MIKLMVNVFYLLPGPPNANLNSFIPLAPRSSNQVHLPPPSNSDSFNLTQKCHAPKTRLISEPKTCKAQGMIILKISAYQLPPLP